jgi:uncharacterized protein (DUF2147 family)
MLIKMSFRFVCTLAMLLLASTSLLAQKDKIEGRWFNAEGDAKVEIYKGTDNKFYGKIVWLKDPDRDGKPKTDINNPKEALRNRPIIGLAILKGFVKDGEKTYGDGTIYDPKSGKTYSCKMTWQNSNTLSIRGYVGVSMLGKTTTWTRAAD